MNPNEKSGYLIVLADPEQHRAVRPKYRGVGRVPEYPSSYPGESGAMDEYVFGAKDLKTNLIPSRSKAFDLATALSTASTRLFEVLWCSAGPGASEAPTDKKPFDEFLGYDVAALESDYWSIVGDFSESNWAVKFTELLNKNGLFDSRQVAVSYLEEYRKHGQPDSDAALDVVCCWLLKAGGTA